MQANHRKSLSFPQGQRGCPSCELQPTLVEVPIAGIAAMAAIAWLPRPSRTLELQVSSQVESDLPAVTAETVATGAPETTQATETRAPRAPRAPRALPVRAPVSLRNKNLILAGDSNDQRFFQALCRTAEPGQGRQGRLGFGVTSEVPSLPMMEYQKIGVESCQAASQVSPRGKQWGQTTCAGI
jgi:hypothetical protein